MIIEIEADILADLILVARLCEAKAKNSPFWYLAYRDADLVLLARHLDALEGAYKQSIVSAVRKANDPPAHPATGGSTLSGTTED